MHGHWTSTILSMRRKIIHVFYSFFGYGTICMWKICRKSCILLRLTDRIALVTTKKMNKKFTLVCGMFACICVCVWHVTWHIHKHKIFLLNCTVCETRGPPDSAVSHFSVCEYVCVFLSVKKRLHTNLHIYSFESIICKWKRKLLD